MKAMLSIIVLLVSAAVVGVSGLSCTKAVPQQYRPTGPVEQFRNDDWAAVLNKVVTDEGWVRWDLIKSNDGGVRDRLLKYVGLIGEVSPENRPELFSMPGDRLAYYINAYNSICMYAVVKRGYPGNVLSSGGIPGSIFVLDKFPVGGSNLSLDALEKQKVRTAGDPRVHFALNCMSRSCPKLRREPYEGRKLDRQFDEQGKAYSTSPYGAVRDGEKVKLGEIFRFYTDDFVSAYEKKTGKTRAGQAGLLEAIEPYAAPDSPIRGASGYEFMKYDWSLNTPI